MSFRRTLAFSLAAGLLAAPAAAQPRPRVVELFTSQGCSSCPPADQLLGELAGRPGVLALAYHIDYWDGLGWKDPFSLAAATQRQRSYARALHLNTIYTPQMVVDGRSDMVGSDRRTVLASVAGPADGVALSLMRTSPGAIGLELPAAKLAGPADITLVFFSREAETNVNRGENAGKRLKEYAIVRDIRPLGSWDGEARSMLLDISALRGDGTDVAVLIQAKDQGAILGAASLALR